MTILKFRGKTDHRIPKPGIRAIGQYPVYLGLTRDEKTGEYSPCEFEVESASSMGLRLIKLVQRDASFEPANEAAAVAVGSNWEQPKLTKKEARS